MSLIGFSKLKIEFDGNVNSDGTFIKVFLESTQNEETEFYYVRDMNEINKVHSFLSHSPYNQMLVKVELYINPPVCGQNEFKYNRIIDLKIYGVK